MKPRAVVSIVGLLAAAAVFGAVVLLLGGSDGSGQKSVVEAKSLLAPQKFESSSTELADTIANLNKQQLKVSDQLRGAEDSGGVLADPKVVDQGLKDIAAQSMRSAELANVLAETARSQDGASDTAAQMAAQYDAIARAGYSQVIEAQRLRDQYAQGLIGLTQIITVINFYGATLWNPVVTVQGVTGNPFVPFVDPAIVDISINLAGPAVTQVTTQIGGGNVGVWISASATSANRGLTFDLPPIVSTFDPYDPKLIVELLSAEGQTDAGRAIRIVLARLEQYNRAGATDTGVTFAGFAGLDGNGGLLAELGDVDRTALLLGGLPRFGGRVTLGMALPRGLVLVDETQVAASNVYTFSNGRSVIVVSQNGQPAPGMVLLGWQGGTSSLLGRVVLAPVQPFISLTITDARSSYIGVRGDGALTQGLYNVELDMQWLATVPFSIYCGAFQVDVQTPNGSLTLSLKEFRAFADGPPRVQCAAYYSGRLYGLSYRVLPAGDTQLLAKQLAAVDTYVNVYETKVEETTAQASLYRVQEAERIQGERAAAEAAEAERIQKEEAAAAAGSAKPVPTATRVPTASQPPVQQPPAQQPAQQPPAQPAAPAPTATRTATPVPQPQVVQNTTFAHNSPGITTTALQSGKQYRVCLSGTIQVYTNSGHSQTSNITAAQAFITVAGTAVSSGSTGCVTLNGSGGGVTIKCDGTRFQGGNPYWGTQSGSYSVQVTLLNP